MTHTDNSLIICKEKLLLSEFWAHQERYPELHSARYLLVIFNEQNEEYIVSGSSVIDRAEFVQALQDAIADGLLCIDLSSSRIEHGPKAWKSIVTALDKSQERKNQK